MKPIKNIIIAEDHPLTLDSIVDLAKNLNLKVLDRASNYEQLENLLQLHQPDAIISDCQMPGKGPLDFLSFLKTSHPDVRIIFLTGIESGLLFEQLLELKVDGLVSKKDTLSDLEKAIRDIENGKVFVSDFLQSNIDFSPNRLTSKEFEVLKWIAAGKSTPEICNILNISTGTVNTHRRRIMKKLNVHTAVDLTHVWRKSGLK